MCLAFSRSQYSHCPYLAVNQQQSMAALGHFAPSEISNSMPPLFSEVNACVCLSMMQECICMNALCRRSLTEKVCVIHL